MTKIRNKKAFSLIELSIVVLIIGIIIAGITQSSRLLSLYRTSSGKTQTQSSPVHSMKGIVAWYETTLEESFDQREAEDYYSLSNDEKEIYKGRLSVWNDISSTTSSRNNATQDTKANRPIYHENCINGLPCVDFAPIAAIGNNVAEAELFFNFDGRKIGTVSGTDYTIFVVEEKETTNTTVFLGSTDTGANSKFALGYQDADTVVWTHDDNNAGNAQFTPGAPDLSDNQAVLHVIVNEAAQKQFGATTAENLFYYVNGSSTPETITSTMTSNFISSPYNNASIGTGHLGANQHFYEGSIGEIIIFSRALSGSERNDVENYLIKKWQIRPDNS